MIVLMGTFGASKATHCRRSRISDADGIAMIKAIAWARPLWAGVNRCQVFMFCFLLVFFLNLV